MEKTIVKRGTVLIAEPFMMDTFFHRTVVLICQHDKDGSFGFCLNKPLELMINDVVDDFPEFEARIYCGGPVRQRSLYFLHDLGDMLEDSSEISQGVWWGSNFEALKILVKQGLVTPERIRFFVGFSGWGENQLDEEMGIGSWVTTEMHPNYMFKEEPKDLWQKTLEHKGRNFAVIAGIPDVLNLN